MDLSDKHRSDERHSRPLFGLGWSMIPPLWRFPLPSAPSTRNITPTALREGESYGRTDTFSLQSFGEDRPGRHGFQVDSGIFWAKEFSVQGIGIVGYTKLPLTTTDRRHMFL